MIGMLKHEIDTMAKSKIIAGLVTAASLRESDVKASVT